MRHPGRWVATAVVLSGVIVFAKSVVTNPRYRWGVVGHNLFGKPIVNGVKLTLLLMVVAQFLAR